MSGWIQAAMQQNTMFCCIFGCYCYFYSSNFEIWKNNCVVFVEPLKSWKSQIFWALSFHLCNEKWNSAELFNDGNYSREETIRGNTVFDNFTPIVLDISEVCCFKTRKNQGLPLTWISSQLSIWAHKCHSRLNLGAKIKIARCLKSLL